jgi:hypothetical protein
MYKKIEKTFAFCVYYYINYSTTTNTLYQMAEQPTPPSNDDILPSNDDAYQFDDEEEQYEVIIQMLISGVKSEIDDALDIMKEDPSLCTKEVRTQLDDMVDQGISVESITDFLLVHDQ